MSRTQFSDQCLICDWFCPSFCWTLTHELCWISVSW